jgi:hypothetical protein
MVYSCATAFMICPISKALPDGIYWRDSANWYVAVPLRSWNIDQSCLSKSVFSSTVWLLRKTQFTAATANSQ